ncbi:unnamed protein product [Closterium sp. Yama58-4]|nr:unnamed protein product [Closterium sp. Yama58-4]
MDSDCEHSSSIAHSSASHTAAHRTQQRIAHSTGPPSSSLPLALRPLPPSFYLSTVIANAAAAADDGRPPGPCKRTSRSSLAARSPWSPSPATATPAPAASRRTPCCSCAPQPCSYDCVRTEQCYSALHALLPRPSLLTPLFLPLLSSPPSFSLPPTPSPFPSPPGSITARDERVWAAPFPSPLPLFPAQPCVAAAGTFSFSTARSALTPSSHALLLDIR